MGILFSVLLTKLFTICFGIYYFGELNKAYKSVLLLTVIAAICESYGYYISHILHKTNAWLFNFYMLFEVYSLGIAAIWLITNRKLKLLYSVLLVIDTIYWIINIKLATLYLFASSAMIFGCIILSFMYIVILFREELFFSINIFSQPIFWLSISTILYFAGVIPIMGLHNFLTEKMPNVGANLEYINLVLDIIRYPLVGISFVLLGRNKPLLLK